MADSLRIGNRGFALLSVLWGIAVLSLIAAAVTSSSALSWRFQRQVEREASLRAAADAAVARACLALLDERPGERWRGDGRVEALSFAGQEMRVTIKDQTGLIDLNATDFDTLRRLFVSVGLEDARAVDLANRILDWREADGLHRLGHDSAGSRANEWRPRHGPFQSRDELLLLPGMTSELYAAVSPSVTVFSQKGNVDPAVAPASVLVTLPGVDADRASDMVAERERSDAFSLSGQTFVGRAFSVEVEIEKDAQLFREEAIFRVTPDGPSPCLMLSYD